MARRVDRLYAFEVTVAVIMSALIFLAIFVFAIKYRRRSAHEVSARIEGSLPVEIFWSVVPLLVCFVMFGWGTKLYFENATPPRDAMEIYVTGKQWMWKIQHPEGRREINELHVPIGRAVKLTLASEDVIHSFFLPAFRVKKDVVPGKYQSMWFEADTPGKYHLFCAEYCGTNHSRMIGWVYAMEPAEFETWLSGGTSGQSMVSAGEALFRSLGCSNCHSPGGRCPLLNNVYGSQVKLSTGQTVLADDNYVRESILAPDAKIVAGFPNIMPTFQGVVSEEQLMQLMAYVRSLGRPIAPAKPAAGAGKEAGAPKPSGARLETEQAARSAEK